MFRSILFIMVFSVFSATSNASIIWSGAIDHPFDSGGQGDVLQAFLDVNQDSVVDFQFLVRNGAVTLIPLNGSAAISSSGVYMPIAVDISIESDAPETYEWSSDALSLGSGFYHTSNAYLGASYKDSGEDHYCWLQFYPVVVPPHPPYDLQGYTYLVQHDLARESEPNTPIVAGAVPEPSSVFLAFLGAFTLWGLKFRKDHRQAGENE